MASLQHLELEAGSLGDDGLRLICFGAANSGLLSLYLHNCARLGPSALTIISQAPFAPLLSRFRFSGYTHDISESLPLLVDHTRGLADLGLAECFISAAALAKVCDTLAWTLRGLNLAGCAVSEAHVEALLTLPLLESLNLDSTALLPCSSVFDARGDDHAERPLCALSLRNAQHVDSACLVKLAQCTPSLTSLDVAHTGASDDGCLEILRCCPELRTLILDGCPVTRALTDWLEINLEALSLTLISAVGCPGIGLAALSHLKQFSDVMNKNLRVRL
jgi:hypothetical protein